MTKKKRKDATPKPLTCECGAQLPHHLLFVLNAHTCSCGRHFEVDNPKTDKAAFRAAGWRRPIL